MLTPTRELAIQVAEAFQKYAHHMPGFHVLPVYGGQSMVIQLRALSRGAHVIVGTPGRIMDHLERKSLNLDDLRTLVLDEADEMLRMGFIDDVEWILEHTPATRQTALFSATMPDPIRRIAQRYLREPAAGEDPFRHHDGRDHPATLLAGARRRQAGGADAHARSRGGIRGRPHLRAHQDRDGRPGRTSSKRAATQPPPSTAT